MIDLPLVSIIIPIFNGEKYLLESVNSALSQSYPNTEIILVDDGSTDSSAEIIKGLISRSEKIKGLRHDSNRGLGPARNYGMDHAKGEFLLFLDSDDKLNPATVEKTLTLMVDHNADMVRFAYDRFSDKGETNGALPLYPEHFYSSSEDLINLAKAIFNPRPNEGIIVDDIGASACTVLYRTSFLKHCNLRFQENKNTLSEDFLFNFEALLLGGTTYYLPEYLYHYRHNTSSKTHTADPNLSVYNSSFCIDIQNTALSHGLSKDDAQLLAMNYCVSILRGLGKNAILSDMRLRDKRIWLNRQSNHPYIRNVASDYDLSVLPFKQRMAFRAFTSGNFFIYYILVYLNEKLHRLLR